MRYLRVIFLFLIISNIYSNNFTPYAKAEWDKPTVILMHTPGDEVFYGILHAGAALFEAPFDRFKAAEEHKNYIKTLESHDIKVIQVTDVLLEGTLNSDGSKKEGKELDELIQFTYEALTYDMPSDWAEYDKDVQEAYKMESLKKFHPKDLVRILLMNPVIRLRYSFEGNTNFKVEPYMVKPLMNIYFLRDQQITTDKGVVICQMNSSQRHPETNLLKFVFKKLGITPVYEIIGEGCLEGGDFIPVGDFALIGQGLRTNEEGIKQLFENGTFGYDEVGVVKDPFKNQDQMHLDTYFNIIGPNLALVDTVRRQEEHINRDGETKKIRPTVDVYTKNEDGTYNCNRKDVDFFDYMEKEKGFEIIDIEDCEQLKYGCNFLCISPNTIIGVDGVSENYAERFKSHNVKATLLDFRNMLMGYGGPHCTTQVLHRIPSN